jgi:hypothetical protein
MTPAGFDACAGMSLDAAVNKNNCKKIEVL